MSTLILSLLSTPTSHVKLVTETKEDASIIVNSSDLLDDAGGFQGLDFQFEINKNEVNNFDNFSGAKYKSFETGQEMSRIDGIPYMMTFMDRDEAEIAMAIAAENYDRNTAEDDIFSENSEYDYDTATAFVDDKFEVDPSYNSDNAW